MNVTGLIFLGAGYLLGNPPAREKFSIALQQLAGQSIDALNSFGKTGSAGSVDADVVYPTEPKE